MARFSLWSALCGSHGSRSRRRSPQAVGTEPAAQIESLENRVVLYAASGNAWPNPQLITISFMPDGTSLGSTTSNLISTFNTKFGSAATWQNQILKAAQFWAQQTNINFSVVTDSGAALGSGSYQQGDPTMGDIRFGGYNFGNTTIAQAYMPPPVNNYSIAGDIQLNTGLTFNIGTTYDLFSVAVHEIGHALGLNHSSTSAACMYATYAAKTALNSDDISGIKAIYSAGAVRAKDAYDAAADNPTTAKARDLTSLINSTTKTVVVNNMDLTTSSDVDVYKVIIPSGAASTLRATAISTGLSLLKPKIEILNSSGTVKATTSGTTYGATVSASTSGVTAGQVYYIRVTSPDSIAAFKTGRYGLVLNMGTGTDPALTYPATSSPKGTTLTSGGGQALLLTPESAVSTTTSGTQVTSDRSIASSTGGSYAAVWSSQNQDGSGYGIYARLYDKNGNPQTGEFQVNTTTVGDQTAPSVGMDIVGNFVVTWTSAGQDGSGSGIYGQRYNTSGAAVGGEFLINSTTTGDQTASSVAMDGFGGFLVTWTGSDGSGTGIFAKRYSFDLTTQTAEFRVNTATAGDQSDSAVAVNRVTGEAIVTWTSAGQDGSGTGVYGQRYTALSVIAGLEFRINTTTAGDQTDPAVTINRLTGDFIVTWTSAGQDGSGTGIYAQRFSTLGIAQGVELRVNTTTTGDQLDSSVAMDASGNTIVVWSGSTSNYGWQVYGQQLTPAGAKFEGEMVLNGTAAGDQGMASVTSDFHGRLTVVWSGAGAADSAGVQFARFRTDLHTYSAEEHDHGDGDHDHGSPVAVPRGVTPATPVRVESQSARRSPFEGSAELVALIRDLRQGLSVRPRASVVPAAAHRTIDRVFESSRFQADLFEAIQDLRSSRRLLSLSDA